MKTLLSNPGDNPEGKDFMKKNELAARLGMTRRSIQCLVARKAIPCIRIGPRVLWFSLRAVRRALGIDDE